MNHWLLIFSTLTLVFSSSYIIYFLEPETFTSPFEGLWWTMTTVVTVGYGDVSPTTVPGKLFAMLLYIVGIGLMTIFIGKVIDSISIRKKLQEEGRLKITTEQHIIMINWTKKAEIALEELVKTFKDIRIVIIDEKLAKIPILHEQVEFVKGDPANVETLKQANVLRAKSVMVFSPDGTLSTSQADGQTLLIASIIEGIGKECKQNIYTICEVVDSKHMQAFVHANVEEFITANDTAGNLAARSILFNGSSEIIRQLTSNKGYDLYSIPKKQEWVTYTDASNALSAMGALLISDGNDLSIINSLDRVIPTNANLFIICNNSTYNKIIKTL